LEQPGPFLCRGRRPCGESSSRCPPEEDRQAYGALQAGPPSEADPLVEDAGEDLLALDEALAKLSASEPVIGDLVKLRYFAGLTIDQVAQIQGISRRTVIDRWAYARSWLAREIAGGIEARAVVLNLKLQLNGCCRERDAHLRRLAVFEDVGQRLLGYPISRLFECQRQIRLLAGQEVHLYAVPCLHSLYLLADGRN
jgi:hypothetical protein